MDALIVLVSGFVAKYPVIASVFMVMGVLRAIMKPLFALLHAYVIATPSSTDDGILVMIEESKVAKGLAFVLDYMASIKLIK